MLIWGSAGESKNLGFIESGHCQTCERTKPFNLVLHYRYAHIWYIFQWVSKKQYYKLCGTCQHGFELDNKKVEAHLTQNPISLYKRFSWAILIALMVGIVVFAQLDSKQQQDNYVKYFNAPQTNDLYLADISKFETAPEHSPLYGVMKVKALTADGLEFYVSKYGYDKKSGTSKDIRSGDADNDSYYGEETLTLPRAELESLRDNGTISGIERR